jgi:hypothetical protein
MFEDPKPLSIGSILVFIEVQSDLCPFVSIGDFSSSNICPHPLCNDEQ